MIHTQGGAVTVGLFALTINGGNVDASSADFAVGGGIYNAVSSLTISNCVISGNTVEDNADPSQSNGGGIATYGETIITNSTISGNTAMNGGGIYTDAEGITITNSTISGNTATDKSGGIQLRGAGALYNVTVAKNSAETGGGITSETTANTVLENTLVADNTASVSPDCAGTISKLNHSIIEANECFFLSMDTLITSDPSLAVLANNGGTTQTHKLKPGSIAINAGNPSGCVDSSGVVLKKDQRGKPSPVNSICDIGAFEL